MGMVVKTLRAMAGARERCMYCIDSHGSDVEHFWPKGQYPERTFIWSNMLLCCTECGRFKGSRFPLADGQPLLVDPSAEDPWAHLDFDPDTGNLTARYDPAGQPSAKGETTVDLLQLDRREAMAIGNLRTYRRLSAYVREVLGRGEVDTGQLVYELQQLDDHGLMGWCFGGAGARLAPFDELRRCFPDAWAACAAAAG